MQRVGKIIFPGEERYTHTHIRTHKSNIICAKQVIFLYLKTHTHMTIKDKSTWIWKSKGGTYDGLEGGKGRYKWYSYFN